MRVTCVQFAPSLDDQTSLLAECPGSRPLYQPPMSHIRPPKASVIGKSLCFHGADFVTCCQFRTVGRTPHVARRRVIRIEPAPDDPQLVLETPLSPANHVAASRPCPSPGPSRILDRRPTPILQSGKSRRSSPARAIRFTVNSRGRITCARMAGSDVGALGSVARSSRTSLPRHHMWHVREPKSIVRDSWAMAQAPRVTNPCHRVRAGT